MSYDIVPICVKPDHEGAYNHLYRHLYSRIMTCAQKQVMMRTRVTRTQMPSFSRHSGFAAALMFLSACGVAVEQAPQTASPRTVTDKTITETASAPEIPTSTETEISAAQAGIRQIILHRTLLRQKARPSMISSLPSKRLMTTPLLSVICLPVRGRIRTKPSAGTQKIQMRQMQTRQMQTCSW